MGAWDCPGDDSFGTPQLDDAELCGFAKAAWTSVADCESPWPDSPGIMDAYFPERERAKLLTPARSPSDIMRRGSLYDPEARSTQSPSLGSQGLGSAISQGLGSAILATGSGCSTVGPRFVASGSGGFSLRRAVATPCLSSIAPSSAAVGTRDRAVLQPAQLAAADGLSVQRPQGVVRTLDFSTEAIPHQLSPSAPRPSRRLLDDSPVKRLDAGCRRA